MTQSKHEPSAVVDGEQYERETRAIVQALGDRSVPFRTTSSTFVDAFSQCRASSARAAAEGQPTSIYDARLRALEGAWTARMRLERLESGIDDLAEFAPYDDAPKGALN